MARVNLEQATFTEPRYALLGKLIGRDRWSALGRMAVVYNACQERGVYAVPIDLLNCLFDDIENFADAIVRSGLGRLADDGNVYICGTRGRIEWLQTKRENGRKGGRPKRASNRQESDSQTETKPIGLRAANPPAPAPAPAPAKETVPSSPSLPTDGIEAAEIVLRTAAIVAPMLAMDEMDAALMLRDIEPDPWWIAAAICEAELTLATVKRPGYLKTLLTNKKITGWTAENPRGFVEYSLNPERRKRLAATAGRIRR